MANTHTLLHERAADYARVALANAKREFPHSESLHQPEPRPVTRPRELHPAVYGSLDWHSCVEMHWVLVRLLRLTPDRVPQEDIRALLDAHLSPEAIAGEARYFAERDNRYAERPYGWSWALVLAEELHVLGDADARRWSESLRPLADLFVEGLAEWLPTLDYPVRYGLHPNTAFSCSLALPFARREPKLQAAISETALRWYRHDVSYAAEWEPSAFDFLSPALTEAELMASLLPEPEVASWLERFLPGLAAGEPKTLFTPVEVSDPTDGHIAHLHGLNLSRAWCWRRLASALPAGDPRVPAMLEAAERHATASLDQAVGSDYMVEHWLPAYAVLYLSDEAG